MLRLSIVVPHHDDDTFLENTLVSLLENRDSNQEIVVVHNGSYFDPYQLGKDEVVMVEAPKHYSISQQLNLGFSAATAPLIQVLFPGTQVTPNWADDALELLETEDVACVGIPCSLQNAKRTIYGMESAALPRRKVSDQPVDVVPLLNGSIFRKRILQLVGWLYEDMPREGAELEIQLLLQAMELDSLCLAEPTLVAQASSAYGQERGYETGRQSGLIASAYGNVEGSGVSIESLAKQLGHLASGLMNPKTVAERLGWVMGSRDHSHDDAIRNRLVNAAARLDADAQEKSRVQPASQRRAA
ncbi:MAG: glycosyltransferase [Pirellula sp.]|nr:glycosyltransferase [Pirellula sp.]